MTLQHSKECIERRSQYEKSVKDWETKWPNFCRSCQGRGFDYQSGDWVPYGSTSVQTPGWEEMCESCVGERKCGRCVRDLILPLDWEFDNHVVCVYCGWTDSPDMQLQDKGLVHPSIHFHPLWAPCECEEEDMKRLADEYRQASGDDLEELLDCYPDESDPDNYVRWDLN